MDNVAKILLERDSTLRLVEFDIFAGKTGRVDATKYDTLIAVFVRCGNVFESFADDVVIFLNVANSVRTNISAGVIPSAIAVNRASCN